MRRRTRRGCPRVAGARIYLRVSTEEQDLARQEAIVDQAKAAGYYSAGVYREKASGARALRPELLRLISDLQPVEIVIAEKIDPIRGGAAICRLDALASRGNNTTFRTSAGSAEMSLSEQPCRPGMEFVPVRQGLA
ncbi:MAG: hypothetical protein EOQ43_33630 [Mesorhizobium sp.]|nr:MAG: hypothetical protein EOQ43_33630 [Mesorhizobium sp.]